MISAGSIYWQIRKKTRFCAAKMRPIPQGASFPGFEFSSRVPLETGAPRLGLEDNKNTLAPSQVHDLRWGTRR